MQATHTLNVECTVDGVGFDGGARYANVDSPFCVEDYADLCGININDIDGNSIDAMNDAASQEGPGAWIKVSHTTETI